MPFALAGARIRSRSTVALAVMALLYVGVLGALSLIQHAGLKTQMNDLGNMDQAVWAAAHGDLAMTVSNDTDGVVRSRLGVHANFIFWLIAPLYWLWSDPRLLLFLTTLACAAAGIGLYAFARRRLGETPWALLAPGAFFASPIVHDANLYDFHVVTVATALLVWMVWAFDAGRRRTGFVLFALALACQEHVALVTAFYGVYLALSGERRTGALIIGISLVWLALLLGVIVPWVNHGQSLVSATRHNDRYYWLHDSGPGAVLANALRPDRLRIPFYLLLSGGLAAWRGWRILLMSIPGVLSCLLSDNPWPTQVTGTYYWITDEAVVILACVLAAGEVAAAGAGAPARRGPLHYLGGATLAFSILFSPLPHGLFADKDMYRLPEGRRTLERIKAVIPRDAWVTVQNNLGPHLSQRPRIASYSRHIGDARFALFHVRYVLGPRSGLFARQEVSLVNHDDSGRTVESWLRGIGEMVGSRQWGLIAQEDGFYLFERGALGGVPRPVAERQFEADARRFLEDWLAARRVRPWTRYLTMPFDWDELWNPPAAR
jgi:hypothetical protein